MTDTNLKNRTSFRHHLVVESYNSVMDESSNLGFLQVVYSLTQLIKGLDVSRKQKRMTDTYLFQIISLNVKK